MSFPSIKRAKFFPYPAGITVKCVCGKHESIGFFDDYQIFEERASRAVWARALAEEIDFYLKNLYASEDNLANVKRELLAEAEKDEK